MCVRACVRVSVHALTGGAHEMLRNRPLIAITYLKHETLLDFLSSIVIIRILETYWNGFLRITVETITRIKRVIVGNFSISITCFQRVIKI